MAPTSTPTPTMDRAVLETILSVPPKFENEQEEEKCKQVMEVLSVEEQHKAATMSEAYFIASQEVPEMVTDKVRQDSFLKTARRHVAQENGNVDKAAQALRNTIKWREDFQVDILRRCFQMKTNDGEEEEEEEETKETEEKKEAEENGDSSEAQKATPAQTARKFRAMLTEEFSRQVMIVRGHDKENRAIGMKFTRQSQEVDYDSYVLAQVYITERAVACTEFISQGQRDDVMVIFDFENYDSKCKPPLSALRYMATTLTNCYPNRLFKQVLVGAPLWIRSLYTVLQYLLDADTRRKIIFANTPEHKEKLIGEHVDVDQCMPRFLPGGKLGDEMDMQYFLYQLPFHAPYDK